MTMNKGRTGVENSALSKPTWEIMKIIWEITKFCWEIIFGAIFKSVQRKMVDKRSGYLAQSHFVFM